MPERIDYSLWLPSLGSAPKASSLDWRTNADNDRNKQWLLRSPNDPGGTSTRRDRDRNYDHDPIGVDILERIHAGDIRNERS